MIVVEVHGGVVQAVYGDDDEEVVIVDHDEAASGGQPAWTADIEPVESMHDKTKRLMERGLAIESGEVGESEEELPDEEELEEGEETGD